METNEPLPHATGPNSGPNSGPSGWVAAPGQRTTTQPLPIPYLPATTPSVQLPHPLAVVPRRIAGGLLDWGIALTLYLGGFFLDVPLNGESREVAGLVGMIAAATFLLVDALFLPAFLGWSLGNLASRTRVVRGDGITPPGVGRMVARVLGGLGDWVFTPAIGLVSILTTAKHQRLGDMCGQLYVVDARAVGIPIELQPFNDGWAVPADAAASTAANGHGTSRRAVVQRAGSPGAGA